MLQFCQLPLFMELCMKLCIDMSLGMGSIPTEIPLRTFFDKLKEKHETATMCIFVQAYQHAPCLY